MSDLNSFDPWLSESGPVALVIRESLTPVEGADGVVFPATFAPGEDKGKFAGGYNIDFAPDGSNVCQIDSVGSQANRIEPMFSAGEYAALVPQIIVMAGEREVNLLDAGHRAGDAIVRCSELQQTLHDAFIAQLRGDGAPLAKIAPTSLIFGAWDSRDTQVKVPRLLAATIRAFNVRPLHRSAQYNPPLKYVQEGLLDSELDTGTGKNNPLAVKGFKDNPATWSHGGVIADGGIRRDATLSLSALRLLFAGKVAEKTQSLRRYIFGLALTAFTKLPSGYLRQGCQLVLDPEKPRDFLEVYPDGRRVAATVTHDAALKFAQAAAKAFGVGESKTVSFVVDLAKKDISGESSDGVKPKRATKKSAK